MNKINNEEVVSLVHLMLKVNRGEVSGEEFRRELDRFGTWEKALAIFAAKIVEGKPYRVRSDDPETVMRYCSLACYLGATQEIEAPHNLFGTTIGVTQILFRPPSCH